MTDAALTGRLLVATPPLTDPNFSRSVVLVLEHGEEGALGVILNRASAVPIAHALPDWEALAAEPAVLFLGGPVQREGIIALARVRGGGEALGDSYQAVLAGTGVVDLAAGPLLPDAVIAVRLFAGYAGWAGGQLEAEIDAGGWFVVDATSDDVFGAAPESLWRAVLRRQGGVFLTIPEDPALN